MVKTVSRAEVLVCLCTHAHTHTRMHTHTHTHTHVYDFTASRTLTDRTSTYTPMYIGLLLYSLECCQAISLTALLTLATHTNTHTYKCHTYKYPTLDGAERMHALHAPRLLFLRSAKSRYPSHAYSRSLPSLRPFLLPPYLPSPPFPFPSPLPPFPTPPLPCGNPYHSTAHLRFSGVEPLC